MARAGELGADQALTFLREVDTINLRRRSKVVELAREASGGSFVGRRIAVLGAAFKPHSDDIRDSPALNVAAQASLQGADVVVTDPAALDNAQAHWPDLSYAATAEEAVTGADVVLLATEWPEYTAWTPRPSPRSPAAARSSTRATRSTPPPGAPRAGPTGASDGPPTSAPGKPPDTGPCVATVGTTLGPRGVPTRPSVLRPTISAEVPDLER